MSRFSSSKLRIGFDYRWANSSGVGTYVRNVARELGRRSDCEVVLYVLPTQVSEAQAISDEIRVISRSPYSLRSQLSLPRAAFRDRLSLFHSPFYVIPALMPCPVIVTIHDIELLTLPECIKPRLWHRLAIRFAHRIAVMRAAAVVSDSDSAASELREYFSSVYRKLHVAPLGPSFVFAMQSQAVGATAGLPCNEHQYFLALLGIQVAKKNTVRLLAAYIRYREEGGTARLRLVGTPEPTVAALPPGMTVQRLDALGVSFTGRICDAELQFLISGATAVVHVAIHEGFGLSVLDAMSAGTPVITSNNSAMAEVAGSAAVLVEPTDITSIARQLHRIAEDPALRSRLTAAGLARARIFSWSRCVDMTMVAYVRAARRPMDGCGQ